MANKPHHFADEHAKWEAATREGLSANKVALRFGVSYGVVTAHLKRVGLFKRNYSTNTKLTDQQRLEIVAEYAKGVGGTTLAKKYKVDKKLIYIVLNKVGDGSRPRDNRINGHIEIRNKTHLKKRTGKAWGNTGVANHKAFDSLSDDALYWMGFIAADGSIGTTEAHGGSQPTIHVGVSASDIGHIKAFKKFVGVTEKKIRLMVGNGYAGETGMCSISVSSRPLVNACKSQGIVERKGAGMTVSVLLASSPSFWRGMWDGDGSIASVIPYLSGSISILNQWRKFAVGRGIPFNEPEPNNAKTTHVSHISNSNANEVKKLCEVLGWGDLNRQALLRKRVCARSIMGMKHIPRSKPVTPIDIPGPPFSLVVDGVKLDGAMFKDVAFFVADPKKHNSTIVSAAFWGNVRKELNSRGIQLLLAMPGDSLEGWRNLISSRLMALGHGKGARSYSLIRADGKLADRFYPLHHIQGSVGGRHYALVDDALDPVAFLTMAKPSACRAAGEGCGMLARFAVKGHVPGAASRLLTAALGDRPQDVITFSDHRYTNGGVYSKIGFEQIAEIAPSYCYVKNGRVFNKAELQKKSLFLEAGVMTDETEQVLAARLGYLRMYDVGKTKWIRYQKKQPPA